MPSLFRFLDCRRGSGGHGLRRPVCHGDFPGARAKGDVHAGAGCQSAALTAEVLGERRCALLFATSLLRDCCWGSRPSNAPAQSTSDDGWNPFKWLEPAPRRKRPEPPVDAPIWSAMPPAGVRNRPVESSDLAPVMAPDTSGLPLDLWRGLEMADIERLLAGLDLPPRSPALHQVWRRMLLSSASPPAGAPSPDHFMALRLEALYRSGLLRDMAEVERGAAPGALCPGRSGAQGYRPRCARGGVRNDQVARQARRGFARTPQG